MQGIQLTVELDDRGKPKVTQLSGELDRLGKKTTEAGNKWKSGFDRMGRAVTGLHRKVRSMATSLPAMLGYAGVGASFGALIKQGISFNATLEKTETAFGVIYNDTVRARNAMKELVDFAATTPFQLTEVADSAKTIEAFGIGGTRNLTMVGNAAAAAQRPLQEVAMVFGRIKSGAFGEAFMRLAEMGLATRQMLESEGLQFNKSGSYIGSVDDAMAAITRIMDRRFSGMMDKLSQTWEGRWSTVKDNFSAMAGELARPLFDTLKPRMVELTDILADMPKKAAFRFLAKDIAATGDRIAGTILSWVSNFENVIRAGYGVKFAVLAIWDAMKAGFTWTKNVFEALFAVLALGFERLKIKAAIFWKEMTFQKVPQPLKAAEYFVDGFFNAAKGQLSEAFNSSGFAEELTSGMEHAWAIATGKAKLPISGFSAPDSDTGGPGLDGGTSDTRAEEDRQAVLLAAHEAYLARRFELEQRYATDTSMLWMDWQMNMVDTFSSGFTDTLASTILDTSSSLAENLDKTWQAMKESFVRSVFEMAAQWIASKVKMLLVEKAANAAAATAEATTAAGIAAARTTQTGAAAGAAAAEYHAATAYIPFAGPGIAAAAIAAMNAQIAASKALGGMPGLREGGIVGGIGSGSSDNQIVRLSPGEGVVNRAAVNRVGAGFIDDLNAGRAPGSAGGNVYNEWNLIGGYRSMQEDIEDNVVPILERLIRQGRFKVA